MTDHHSASHASGHGNAVPGNHWAIAEPALSPTWPDLVVAVAETRRAIERVRTEVHKAIVGQDDVVEQAMLAILCGGHAVVEGVPGLAKTLLVSSLAKTLSLQFSRVQFTPDLMPSDMTGTEVIQEDRATGSRALRFVKGPIFANIVLADEINRTPPKTQSAQLDRFMLNIRVNYPTESEEIEIVSRTTSTGLSEPAPVLSAEDIVRMQELVRKIPVSEDVLRHAIRIVRSTRVREEGEALKVCRDYLAWGAGPRASQFLVLAAKARALLDGAEKPTIAHLDSIALPVMRHRIVTNFNAEADGVKADDVVRLILDAVRQGGASRELDGVMR